MLETHYPVLFTHQDIIVGHGFIAKVGTSGRFLMKDSRGGEKVWIYGVNPGPIAAEEDTQKEAAEAFRVTYRHALLDLAHDAASYEHFMEEVNDFCGQTCDETEEEWRQAVKLVREGKLKSSWMAKMNSQRANVAVKFSLTATTKAHPELEPEKEADPSMNPPTEPFQALAA